MILQSFLFDFDQSPAPLIISFGFLYIYLHSFHYFWPTLGEGQVIYDKNIPQISILTSDMLLNINVDNKLRRDFLELRSVIKWCQYDEFVWCFSWQYLWTYFNKVGLIIKDYYTFCQLCQGFLRSQIQLSNGNNEMDLKLAEVIGYFEWHGLLHCKGYWLEDAVSALWEEFALCL